MSTIQQIQLRRQAHDASMLLANAQFQLLVIRERQLAEAEREAEMLQTDALNAERNAEATWDRIDEMARAHGIGDHGSPLEKLDRLSAMLALRNETVIELEGREAERYIDLKVAKERAKLVEVPNELPFDARELAELLERKLAGQIVGQDLTRESLQPWMAAIVMRGHDEHARKYGKLIELAIMGDRINDGDVYSTDAESAIVEEADKHVDPVAPPKGWKPPAERTF